MGILNVTPDSFSDGGKFLTAGAAIAAGEKMLADGADILDIGGESTRPDARAVDPAEECARIGPVITALARQGAVVSVDTRNAATMRAGLGAGAKIINDVSGLTYDAAAARLAADHDCPVVVMHMRGRPADMNEHAAYADVVAEVLAELEMRRDAALAAGIRPENIALDPGIGFAKLGRQNVLLLRATARFVALGHPLLIGLSRKKFLGGISRQDVPEKRGPESLAAGLYAVAQGAHILRVHDVPETVQALRVWQSLIAGDDGPDS